MRVLQKYQDRPRQRMIAGFFLSCTLIAILLVPFFEEYRIDPDAVIIENASHQELFLEQADGLGIKDRTYASQVAFVRDVRIALNRTQEEVSSDESLAFDNWQKREYLFQFVRRSGAGYLSEHSLLFLLIILTLGLTGTLLYITSGSKSPGGINDHIYHSKLTAGISRQTQSALVVLFLLAFVSFGYFYLQGDWSWPLLTLIVALAITVLVLRRGHSDEQLSGKKIKRLPRVVPFVLCAAFVLFYIFLYWAPWYLVPWITVTDPLSRLLNGNMASQWFLYGLLYTLIVLIMGIRMLIRHRNNAYQVIRTCSVMFFQLCFAFLIPEILLRLNQPYFDFKNIWPLNYSFFFDWNLNQLLQSGNLGIFMLAWGIALIIIAVPVFTYLYGKRWYCSWVCGCGGLAETAGDPFRHLSDKSLKAWKYERWIVYGVLLFAVVMTAMVLYTFFTGSRQVFFVNSDSIRTWYGFFIGSVFAGVIGTGFYPVMGSRVWCRFGCPLAAYIGLIQRFKSRFRITVNGGQCISCGNCSTYCEMGIDVRHYAQRGQDVVRASCVGCGICAAVCPRGVLRLENASSDINKRATKERVLAIREGDVRLLD